MKEKTKTQMMLIVMILLAASIILPIVVWAQSVKECHYFGREDVIQAIDAGKDVALAMEAAVKECVDVSFEVDIKSVGFQRFIFVTICVIAGIIGGWEVEKARSKGPEAPPQMPPQGGRG